MMRRANKSMANSFIFAMEDEAEDILDSFTLSDDDWKSYTTVRNKFEAYFVKKRNSF